MHQSLIRKAEKAVLVAVLGAVPLIACSLAGWWISIPLVSESHIFYWVVVGFLVGVVINVLFLRRWIRRAYVAKPWVWMGVYVFYSVGLLGFFMGVPVFNVALAVPAGIFVGRWLACTSSEATRVQQVARRVAMFTSSILGLVCIASASVALASSSTAYDLQHMLGLPFEVTRAMIITLILGGGAALLAFGWWLSVSSVVHAYRFFSAHNECQGS